MRHLTATALLVACLIPSSFAQLEQIERLEEIQREIDETRDTLYSLETEYGRLDRRMLEPLDQFSLQLIENERFTEAHDVIDQAIQIIRVSEGLYSPSQYSLLVRHTQNYINRGDWEAARELLQHLTFLIRRGENQINDELITAILDVIDLHLWGVADDQVGMQSFHFREADRMTNFANRIARFSYEDGDVRVPAIMYKKAVQVYLQSVAVEVGGQTGISLRSYSSTGLAVSRRDARSSLYYSGTRSLSGILNYYLEKEEPNIEAAGIAYLYLGDWEVLFGNSQAASRAYEHANELLLASGQDQEKINLFTSRPQMLPLIDFYDSLDSAIVASIDTENREGEGSATEFTFKQWSAQFPRTIAPVSYGGNEVDMEEGDYALFTFTLPGLDAVNRWYRGRYISNISSPQNLELINQQISSSVDWFELTESIKDFHYRPKLVNGEPQAVSARLTFQLAD